MQCSSGLFRASALLLVVLYVVNYLCSFFYYIFFVNSKAGGIKEYNEFADLILLFSSVGAIVSNDLQVCFRHQRCFWLSSMSRMICVHSLMISSLLAAAVSDTGFAAAAGFSAASE